MATQLPVLQFLHSAANRAERCALVVLTGIEGAAARGLGTLMAVSEGGQWSGSLSGGCVETALVGEAQRVMASGIAEQIRIGAGSPLIDIRLPCGSGMDLLFLPDPDAAAIACTTALLATRKPVAMTMHPDGKLNTRAATSDDSTGWSDEHFILRIDPALRLVIAGHGEETRVLARLAFDWGAEVFVLSPDEGIVAMAAEFAKTALLKSPGRHDALALDHWSALVMLFHDHDWETQLLVQALEQQVLFIGAMGSRTTHAGRLEALAVAGVNAEAAARVCGPIGLIPAARDPHTLALSVLAEVVAAYNAA